MTTTDEILNELYYECELNHIRNCVRELVHIEFISFDISRIYTRISEQEVWCIISNKHLTCNMLEEFYEKTYELSDNLTFFIESIEDVNWETFPNYDECICFN